MVNGRSCVGEMMVTAPGSSFRSAETAPAPIKYTAGADKTLWAAFGPMLF
jgi:hypothetical protein